MSTVQRSEPLVVARPARVAALAHIGPNWFAAVMGTGIIATASMVLPVHVPGLHVLALGAWLLAVGLLGVLIVATALHWRYHPATARGHVDNPAMAPFYGAPAMGVMTVGAGTLAIGHVVIGDELALRVAALLWVLGTIGGLATATVIPARILARHDLALRDVAAPWLMAVVPPMVSAATGAALAAHLPDDTARTVLIAICCAEFVLTIIAAVVLIALLWARLAVHGLGGARMAPTLWIVLGPLGQSVTAANLIAVEMPALHDAAIGYGLTVLAVALVWLAIAAAVTVRELRRGLPFALTWWAFTFPVGTCATGAATLAAAGAPGVLVGVATVLFALLITGWLAAAIGTARGVRSGRLLLPPA